MWKRNLLFIGLILAGIGAVKAALFPPPVPPHVAHFDPVPFEGEEFRSTVRQVDAAVREFYAAEGLKPAPAAEELAVARRLSLCLTGTIPSLQEIRQFEAYQDGQRLQWWLEGILSDRRSADYLRERFPPVLLSARKTAPSWSFAAGASFPG